MDILNSGDWCSTAILIVILLAVGQKMVGERITLNAWGVRLAAAAFVLNVAFLGLTTRIKATDAWLDIVVRSLFLAALVLGLAWIFLAIAAFLCRHLVVPPLAKARALTRSVKQAVAGRTARRQEERRRRDEQWEWTRTAADRERAQREAEAKAKGDADEKAQAQKRREDARLHCELLFNRHARELSNSFPRDQLAEFMNRYMSDAHDPEYVEERGKLLEDMIRESLGPSKERTKFSNLKELADYFEDRRKEVEALTYPDEIKDTYRTQINQEEDKALRRFLQP